MREAFELLWKMFENKAFYTQGKLDTKNILTSHDVTVERDREAEIEKFAFECKKVFFSYSQTDRSPLVHSLLWLVFVVDICNFIQRTSVSLNIIQLSLSLTIPLSLYLSVVWHFTLNAFTHLFAATLQTPIFHTQSDFLKHQPKHYAFHPFQFITENNEGREN